MHLLHAYENVHHPVLLVICRLCRKGVRVFRITHLGAGLLDQHERVLVAAIATVLVVHHRTVEGNLPKHVVLFLELQYLRSRERTAGRSQQSVSMPVCASGDGGSRGARHLCHLGELGGSGRWLRRLLGQQQHVVEEKYVTLASARRLLTRILAAQQQGSLANELALWVGGQWCLA